MDKPIKNHIVVQHEQIVNQKMLAEKHNDEKLAITILIVETALITYHFLLFIIFSLVSLWIIVKRNAKDMIWHLKSFRGPELN